MNQLQISDIKLEKITQFFWDRKADTSQNRDKVWDLYLVESKDKQSKTYSSLLQLEMEYAEYKSCLSEEHENVTLVILVGESLEPLFQSIWAHNPQRLIPVVNMLYPPNPHSDGNPVSGIEHWDYIYGLLKNKLLQLLPRERQVGWRLSLETLPQIKHNPFTPYQYQPVVDEPQQVFEFLCEHLREDLLNPACRVVVDITGAKKTKDDGCRCFYVGGLQRCPHLLYRYREARWKRPSLRLHLPFSHNHQPPKSALLAKLG